MQVEEQVLASLDELCTDRQRLVQLVRKALGARLRELHVDLLGLEGNPLPPVSFPHAALRINEPCC